MPASAADAEQDMVVGYPKLAGLMGRLPQLGIFRRFGALNAQNLLYLQAELTKLAFELRQQEKADAQEEKYDRKKFRLNWQVLSESADSDDFEATEQYNLFLKIRPKLKEYNETLIQLKTITAMDEPKEHDMENLQNFLSSDEMLEVMEDGKLSCALLGHDRQTWGSTTNRHQRASDLVSTQAVQRGDVFSQWLAFKIVPKALGACCVRYRKPSRATGLVSHSHDSLLRLTHFVTGVLASMLLTVSIIVLWFIHSPNGRLGTIAAFNLVLSVCLSVFTTASRAEIFSITAAFAAVQVVFVGSVLNRINI